MIDRRLLLMALALASPIKAHARRFPAGDAPTKAPSSIDVQVASGRRIHAHDWRPDGTPRATILFVHGWLADGRLATRPATDLVGRGIRVIAPDLPGFGLSSIGASRRLGYDAWADDLAAFRRALRLGPVSVVGCSMGGAVAVTHLARHGEGDVRRLVLLNAALPALSGTGAGRDGLPRFAFDLLRRQINADMSLMVRGAGWYVFNTPQPRDVTDLLRAMAARSTPEAALAGLDDLERRDLSQALRRISRPTLIAHGSQDAIVPYGLAERQAALLPAARLSRYGDSGHMTAFDEPERLAAEIEAFVTDQGMF